MPNPLRGIPRRLWRLVSLAQHRLLLLDYDGTLAPFHAERDRALPPPRSRALLEKLATREHTTVAIVSGRPLEEMRSLLGPLPVTLVGEHGWVEWSPGGAPLEHPLPEAASETLSEAYTLALDRGLGPHLERKRTGLVLHTRGLTNEQARALEEACDAQWRPLDGRHGLALDHADGGMELRARGHHKGTATQALIAAVTPESLAVFVGDDVTDADAFKAVAERGFGIRVGAGERPSVAAGRLPDVEAVGAFLEEWLRVVDAASAAHAADGIGRR